MKITSIWAWENPPNFNPEPNVVQGPPASVIIDLYLMTTNLSVILTRNPKRLLIINEENYQAAQKSYPSTLLIGESPIFPLSKFAATWPQQIAQLKIQNKTLLYMTLNGSRAFEKFFQPGKTLIGCALNNLQAVASFLKDKKEILIIKSGDAGQELADDQICCDLLIQELQGKRYAWPEEKAKMEQFIQSYYGHPFEREQSLSSLFAQNQYSLVPICQKNQEGFLEITAIINN